MRKFEVEIQGITPLLMNRFNCEQLDHIQKKVIKTKQTPLEDKLYLFDGKPYVPSIYIERALIEAGKHFKGRGKGTLSTIMGAMVSVSPDVLMITPDKWTIDVRSGVNPTTKGRVIIERPKFEQWCLKFNLLVEIEDIPSERVKEILDFAGMYVGIGDYRPAKKGKFGKFIVSSFREIEERDT